MFDMLADGAAEVRCSSAQFIEKYDLRLGRQVKRIVKRIVNGLNKMQLLRRFARWKGRRSCDKRDEAYLESRERIGWGASLEALGLKL